MRVRSDKQVLGKTVTWKTAVPREVPAHDGVLAAVDAALDGDPSVLADRLLDYYAPGGDECATSFLDGTETIAPNTVTGADLFAVTMLGIPVRPSVARALLLDTARTARVAECLAGLDVTVTDLGRAVISAMTDVHDAIHSAIVDTVGVLPADQAHVLASALCARKRPELFPVLDRQFCAALGLPDATSPVPSWRILHRVLREHDVAGRIAEVYALARVRGAGVRLDIYPLRRLYVLVYVLNCHVRAGLAVSY